MAHARPKGCPPTCRDQQEKGSPLDFSHPGKPTDNSFVFRRAINCLSSLAFNGKVRAATRIGACLWPMPDKDAKRSDMSTMTSARQFDRPQDSGRVQEILHKHRSADGAIKPKIPHGQAAAFGASPLVGKTSMMIDPVSWDQKKAKSRSNVTNPIR